MVTKPLSLISGGWGTLGRDPTHAGDSRAICYADANHFGGVSLSSEVGNQMPPFVVTILSMITTSTWILQV